MPVVLDDATRILAFCGPLLIDLAKHATDPNPTHPVPETDDQITFAKELQALDLSRTLTNVIASQGVTLDVVALAFMALLNELGERQERARPAWVALRAREHGLPVDPARALEAEFARRGVFVTVVTVGGGPDGSDS